MHHTFLIFFLLVSSAGYCLAEESAVPTGLLCDLIGDQAAGVVADRQPELSWIVPSSISRQRAYEIEFRQGGRLMWSSGKVESPDSIAVSFDGHELASGEYTWRVRVWSDATEPTPWSKLQSVTITPRAAQSTTGKYSLLETRNPPARIVTLDADRVLFDFGQTAFGYVELDFARPPQSDESLEVLFGEKMKAGRIDRDPGGTIRFFRVEARLQGERLHYEIHPPLVERNTTGSAIRLPKRYGSVAPFRYVEIANVPSELIETWRVHQVAIHYPFDDGASQFKSSSKVLNEIWDLSKYSMKATSFCGLYVDGDRERIAYEADALLNQLSHYAVDREYSLARATHEFLLTHATWPTEWRQISVLMAWEDYLYTGDLESLCTNFETLRDDKVMEAYARNDGLLSSPGDRDDRTNRFVNRAATYDLVDWPPVERDDFDFRPVQAVVNAYHYRNLVLMGRMAKALGNESDSRQYEQRAEAFRKRYHEVFYNSQTRLYVDGEGSEHSSIHANFFPLAFGLVPVEAAPAVCRYLAERGMACSVYGAQFLIEGLYRHGAASEALQLLTSDGPRSWQNMLRYDATITWEAWDRRFKPNLDWNHAWGAAPANLISRYLVGVRPLEPGFARTLIAPQPAELKWFAARIPTIRGPVQVEYQTTEEGYTLTVAVPGNTVAELHLPQAQGKLITAFSVDGHDQKMSELEQLKLTSGVHKIQILLAPN